mmetsp:Transcript_13283/g.37764  ORF Transcript_13283/g.37764 Transcript_13283/m.37764 type:complete len:231 (+) Transcript_13283:533-1225(+)
MATAAGAAARELPTRTSRCRSGRPCSRLVSRTHAGSASCTAALTATLCRRPLCSPARLAAASPAGSLPSPRSRRERRRSPLRTLPAAPPARRRVRAGASRRWRRSRRSSRTRSVRWASPRRAASGTCTAASTGTPRGPRISPPRSERRSATPRWTRRPRSRRSSARPWRPSDPTSSLAASPACTAASTGRPRRPRLTSPAHRSSGRRSSTRSWRTYPSTFARPWWRPART